MTPRTPRKPRDIDPSSGQQNTDELIDDETYEDLNVDEHDTDTDTDSSTDIDTDADDDSPTVTRTTRTPHTNLLRIIADDYDQAQRSRIAKGEQIRAIAQGRDQQSAGVYLSSLGFLPVVRGDKTVKTAADVLLESILKNKTDEPHIYLASSYRNSYTMERNSFDHMSEALEKHVAWVEWLQHVRGIGPTFGAKLLSRLDLDQANNGSSFWCYCGLSTVPGQRWQCSTCGYVGIHPATHNVTGKHKGCKSLATLTHTSSDGIRAAQPRSERGVKRTYDAFAKKTLFLIASGFLKSGKKSFYNKIYREKRAYYERERQGWEKGRIHLSALRTVQKLFLSHLYEAWCIAEGRKPVPSYAAAVLHHEGIVSAADVLQWEERAKEKVA